MAKKTVRRSITMSQEMHDRLTLMVSKQPRDITEAEIIREAVRVYLDNQEDIIGSRKHFQKSLQDRLNGLESTLTFHLNVLLYLLTAVEPEGSPNRIADAIIAAKRDGNTLLEQIKAVREMKVSKR